MEIFTLVPAAIVIGLLFSTFNILKEYERGVIFMLGRFQTVKGPGLIIVIPVIQQMVKISLRTAVWDIPSQDLITKDNVSVKVNAVLYFRVVDPQKAVINVEDFMEATSQLAQTTLRSVLGQHELDELLSERERLNRDVQDILDEMTDSWGIKVSNVEIKHVDIDESMIRAIAQQAEAERSRRAKVIHAQGEFEASQKLVEAASQLATQPTSIQLRYLQTLTEIAGEQNSTIIFPLPMNLMEGLGRLGASMQAPGGGGGACRTTATRRARPLTWRCSRRPRACTGRTSCWTPAAPSSTCRSRRRAR
jgi:regulator of protease activity HflC (stomatin/prohibitin superfamily)